MQTLCRFPEINGSVTVPHCRWFRRWWTVSWGPRRPPPECTLLAYPQESTGVFWCIKLCCVLYGVLYFSPPAWVSPVMPATCSYIFFLRNSEFRGCSYLWCIAVSCKRSLANLFAVCRRTVWWNIFFVVSITFASFFLLLLWFSGWLFLSDLDMVMIGGWI